VEGWALTFAFYSPTIACKVDAVKRLGSRLFGSINAGNREWNREEDA